MTDLLEAIDDMGERLLSCIPLDECNVPWCFRGDNFVTISTDNEDVVSLDTEIDAEAAMKDLGHLLSDEESEGFLDNEDEDTTTKCNSFDTPPCSMSWPMPQLPPRPEARSGPKDIPTSGEQASAADPLTTSEGPRSSDCTPTLRGSNQRSLSYALDETESKQRALRNMPALTPRPLSNKLKTRDRYSSRFRRSLLRGGCPREDKDVLAELAAGWRLGHGARLLGSGDTSTLNDGSQRSATMFCERSGSLEGLESETGRGINIWKFRSKNARGNITEVMAGPSPAKVPAPVATARSSTTLVRHGSEKNSRIASWSSSGRKESAHRSIKNSVRSIQWWSLGKASRGHFRPCPNSEDASNVVTADNSPLGEPESPRGSSQSSNLEREDDVLNPSPTSS